jgi:itaconyl-CoA hydratase
MRLYEDFQVGDVYRSAFGRTVTETDNLLFTMLTMNTNELHFNDEAAAQTEWGRVLVNSCFTLSLVLGLSVADTSQAGAVNLGWESIRLPHPVFVGDTLWAESVVLATRASRSRPAAGIIEVGTRGLNQDGAVCLTFRRTAMIHRRGADEGAIPFPRTATPISEAFAG